MKNWKRIAFFALAFVMMLGLLPMMSVTAKAADTMSASLYGFTATVESRSSYYYLDSVEIEFKGITEGTAKVEVTYIFRNGNMTQNFRCYFSISDYSCEKEINVEKLKDNIIADITLTRSPGHCGEGWQSKDHNQHTGTCKICGDVTENHKYTNDCDPSCDTCGYTRTIQHDYQYSASGNAITETCRKNCGYQRTAYIYSPQDTYWYTGSPITPLEMNYPYGWAGEEPTTITYEENNRVGTATGKITVQGHELKQFFKIEYLPAPALRDFSANGYRSDPVYYFAKGETATVMPPDGYTISTALGGTYGNKIAFGEDDTKTVYLKQESTGALTDAIDLSSILKWDHTVPTGVLSVDNITLGNNDGIFNHFYHTDYSRFCLIRICTKAQYVCTKHKCLRNFTTLIAQSRSLPPG